MIIKEITFGFAEHGSGWTRKARGRDSREARGGFSHPARGRREGHRDQAATGGGRRGQAQTGEKTIHTKIDEPHFKITTDVYYDNMHYITI